MADQPGRQSFRFRLPWVVNPALAPPRGPQPTAGGPPFRPPGAVPPRPFIPTRPDALSSVPPSRVVSQPSSPTRQPLATQVVSQPPSRIPSQPSSPSKPSPPSSRVASQPSSPKPVTKESQSASPTRTPPDQTKAAAFKPSSPPSLKTAPVQASPQPPSQARVAALRTPSPTPAPYSQPPPLSVQQIEKSSQTPPNLSLPTPLLSKPDAQQETRSLDSISVPTGPSSTQAAVAEAIKEQDPTRKPEVRREDVKPPAEEEEPKQRTITELPSVQPKRPFGYKPREEEQSQQVKPVGGEEKEIISSSTTAGTKDQRKTAAPTIQKDRISTSATTEPQQKPSLPRGERPPLHKDIRDDVSKMVHKLGGVSAGHPKQYSSDGNPVSVITLAGDNKGASMHLGRDFARKEGSVPIQRGYKLNQKEDNAEGSTDGESSAKERRKSRDPTSREDEAATRAYVNSNIQSVNNSIMFNSSSRERSPGVHLFFSRGAKEVGSEGKVASVETRKADFTVSQPQQMTYEPTVRRRCLRGLFLEPVDSDPDNPNKPRRHGCRFNCATATQEKKNENQDCSASK